MLDGAVLEHAKLPAICFHHLVDAEEAAHEIALAGIHTEQHDEHQRRRDEACKCQHEMGEAECQHQNGGDPEIEGAVGELITPAKGGIEREDDTGHEQRPGRHFDLAPRPGETGPA